MKINFNILVEITLIKALMVFLLNLVFELQFYITWKRKDCILVGASIKFNLTSVVYVAFYMITLDK